MRCAVARARKPLAVHAFENTVPEWTAPRQSSVVGGRPRIPVHLKGTARTEYKRLVQYLEKRGTVTEADVQVLCVAAEVSARWIEAKEMLANEGLQVTRTVLDSSGNPHEKQIINPLLAVVEKAEQRLLALTRSLGLTPDTREKVKRTKPNPKKFDIARPEDFLKVS